MWRVRGANYGWPNCEGSSCGSNPAYTSPIYSYPHNGRDASITGGFIYRGSQFPAEYCRQLLLCRLHAELDSTADVQRQRHGQRRVQLRTARRVTGRSVRRHRLSDRRGRTARSTTSIWDSPIPPGRSGISRIRRIRFIWDNQPPTAAASASPTEGPAPLTVNFSSAGSADPEGAAADLPVELWRRRHVHTGESGPHLYANRPVHGPADGIRWRGQLRPRLRCVITVGNRPVPNISSPANGLFFRGGDTIAVTGDATDIEDGNASGQRLHLDRRFPSRRPRPSRTADGGHEELRLRDSRPPGTTSAAIRDIASR